MTVQDNGRDTLQMQAQVNSGEGSLNLQGEAKLLSLTDWHAQLKITGNHFEAVNMPFAWALISPAMEVILSPRELKVTGQLIIPQAAITPPEAASGTVSASTDVVILNPANPPTTDEKKLESWPVRSDLKIILGDQVTFKGAGLKSRLSGSLRASNQPGKVTVGNGELLIDGIYKAYGQDLTVAGGRIIFTGGPIDNPGLDIRAFRRIYQRGSREATGSGTSIRSDTEVIAGVHIHGLVKSPELTLYSRPALDQSNTLSYIVLGKPVSQASGEEGKALLGAALASQFQGSGDSLTQKIANQFGLDEASISSTGGVTESELIVGKYLSPELYISYGVGLFDARTVLRIRYQLSKRLTLETETGTQSGVDLRYSFEH
jgi:translocation and assembly module TamB